MTEKNKHENIGAALAAFQAEMPTVHKGKTANTGKYNYSYADIADVTQAVMPLLAKHGLSFMCTPRSTPSGYEIAGFLLHESGTKSEEGVLPLFGGTAQQIGSAITYMRRYLLGTLTGVVTDDDEDGAAANQTSDRPQRQRITRAAAPENLTEDQFSALASWADEGVNIKDVIHSIIGPDAHSSNMSRQDGDKVLAYLTGSDISYLKNQHPKDPA